MEDPEVPTEHLHEHIHEAAHEGHDRWSMLVAISTAFMAAFAALSSLMAGHQSNEALITQIKASDQWSYYNAKGIKAEVADAVTRINFSKATDSTNAAKERKAKLKEDQKKIQEKAEELEKESERHLHKDMILARSVTFFQIAISISAISILSKKRSLWYISLILFATGIFQFIVGLL
jgi:LPS O-antigen subunit length determinant protein (WzzB/FepE family)